MKPTGQPAPDVDVPAAPVPKTGTVRCSLCAHTFNSGGISGNMYCPRCGRRFNPNAAMEETVAINPRSVGDDQGLLEPTAKKDREEEEAVGERFGEYDIISEVARGGMGVVYRARQRTLKRIVALKVLRGGEGASEEDLERFMREAKAAASLSHPNIVPIHELNVYKGQHFFTMDYIEGTPLDRMLEAGPLTPYQACELIEVIARAIHYAHTRGIIHRDLKPANIIIDTEGRPMLTDFGLAVNLSSDVRSQRMTRTGAVMGTIPYIPPEQAAGHVDDVDARSDVYSLGAVLYEILTGRAPFQGQTQFELLRRIIHQDPIAPRKVSPRIHPDVETICMRCLEKDPRRRYDTASALADDCRAFLHGEVIQARPASLPYRLYRKALRHRSPLALVSCIVVLALAAIGLIHHARAQKLEKEEIKDKLASTAVEKELAEIAVAEYKKELTRTWRQQYATVFDRTFRGTSNRGDRYHPWLDPKYVKHDNKKGILEIRGVPREEASRSLVGIHIPLPLNFKLTARVRVPEGNPGTLLLLVNTDQRYEITDATQIIRMGVPGYPGAKIAKGEATLAENPTFEMRVTPEAEWEADAGWQTLELVREEGAFRVWWNRPQATTAKPGPESDDGKSDDETEETPPLLENRGPDVLGDTETVRLALGVRAGLLQVKDLTIAVRGLSQPMIRSLLELAGSLDLHREHRLALTLYERVAIENTQRSIHIRALRGCARCLATTYGNRRDAPKLLPVECKDLIDRIEKSRQIEKGEREFFGGLVFAMLSNAGHRQHAVGYFQAAFRAARPRWEDFLHPERCLVIGPFAAPEGFASSSSLEQEEFSLKREYHGKAGTVRWTPIGHAQKLFVTAPFPGKSPDLDNTIFYVRRSLQCEHETPVTIHVGSDDGLVMWINGQQVLTKDVQRAVHPDDDKMDIVLPPGETVLLLKIHNRNGGSGFALKIVPHLENLPIGAYGLLAQLEAALTYLRLKQVSRASDFFTNMQKSGILTALGQDYRDELRAGDALARVLETIDDMLRRKDLKDLKTPEHLLDSLGALYPDAGKELAVRYHRLAKHHLAKKAWAAAEGLLDHAIASAEGWYLPRFDRALLFFNSGEIEKGRAALEEATQATPESFDLHVAIAKFYLETKQPELHSAALAYQAAHRAVEIADQKNPIAWELCARALLLEEQYTDARDAIEQALLLERTPPRQKLLQQINDTIERLQTEEEAGDEDMRKPPAERFPELN